jgi:hypothetical protein
MDTLKVKTACKTLLVYLFFLLLTALPGNTAEIDESIAKCADIKDSTARLQCFDNLAKQKAPAKDTSLPPTVATAAAKEPSKEKSRPPSWSSTGN